MTDGELTGLLFETVAEPKLIQPTMLYDFPTDISPLAKCRPDDPSLVERFEVFVAGMELGNAFSELNDPDEQERRFREQVAQGGDEVPREVDLDYVRALAHGLPPDGRHGHRHRPADHAADRFPLDPRSDSVSAAASGSAPAAAGASRQGHEIRLAGGARVTCGRPTGRACCGW